MAKQVCPECESLIPDKDQSRSHTCEACNSKLIWTGLEFEPQTVTPTGKPLRDKAPDIKVSALLDIVEVEPKTVQTDKIKCLGCDRDTDKLASHAVKLTIGYGNKHFETENLDNLGFPIMMIRSFPIMRDGRICPTCFGKVERRGDKQSHFRWYLGKRQVTFTFENTPGETFIPEVERFRAGNPVQARKLDKGKTIPGTDIVLHVDQTPEFEQPYWQDANGNKTEPMPDETHEESFKKFGFSRGSRDYRKYIR